MRDAIRFLLIPYLALVALRIVLAWPLDVPVTIDELRFLGQARYLATGEDPVDPQMRVLYRVGYPLLISPAFLLEDDPAGAFKVVQILNAFLMSLTYPLAFCLAGMLREMSPADRRLIAGCVSLYPAALLYSTTAMSANAFLPAFFAVLITAAAALARPSPGRWLACFAATGFLVMIHERAAVIAAVLMAVFLLHLLPILKRRFNLRPRVARTLAWASAAFLLGLTGWITSPGSLAGSQIASQLTTFLAGFRRPESLWVTGSGQLWYLGLATFGILFAGLFASLPAKDGRWRVPPLFWWLLGGSAAGIYAVSVIFLAPSWERFSYWIYGRYNEGVLLPVLLAVLCGLRDSSGPENRRRLVLATVAALVLIGVSAGVLVSHWTPATGPAHSFNASALAVHGQLFGWGILRASASATLGLLVLGLLFSFRWRWGVAGLALLFGFSTWVTYRGPWLERAARVAGQQELVKKIDQLAPDGSTIFRDGGRRRSSFNYFNIRYLLPRFDYAPLPRNAPPGALILSGRSDFGRFYPGARLIGLENLTFRARSYIQTLWVLPGPILDDAAARGWLFPESFPGPLGDEVLKADLRLTAALEEPILLGAGTELPVEVEVRHLGIGPWPHRGGLRTREFSVGLVTRWEPPPGAPEKQTRVDLPRTLYPGETFRKRLPLRATLKGKPLPAGNYRVRITLAQMLDGEPRPVPAGAIELEVVVTP